MSSKDGRKLAGGRRKSARERCDSAAGARECSGDGPCFVRGDRKHRRIVAIGDREDPNLSGMVPLVIGMVPFVIGMVPLTSGDLPILGPEDGNAGGKLRNSDGNTRIAGGKTLRRKGRARLDEGCSRLDEGCARSAFGWTLSSGGWTLLGWGWTLLAGERRVSGRPHPPRRHPHRFECRREQSCSGLWRRTPAWVPALARRPAGSSRPFVMDTADLEYEAIERELVGVGVAA